MDYSLNKNHSEENKDNKDKSNDEKNKKNSKALFAFLIFLIIFSLGIYYFISSNSQSTGYGVLDNNINDINDPLLKLIDNTNYNYNNFDFHLNEENLWETKILNPLTKKEMIIKLNNGPAGLTKISRSQNLNKFILYMEEFRRVDSNINGAVYISYPPDANGTMGVAFLEVYNNLNDGMSISAFPAFSNNNSNNKEFRIIEACSDLEEPVIFLRYKSPTQIMYKEPNCIIVQGEDKELWKAENLLLYIFYGIIPN